MMITSISGALFHIYFTPVLLLIPLRGCDPPCLSMRNNAPVEHCVAEAFILHREIVPTMKASFTLRAYLMSEDTRKSAMKNKTVIEIGNALFIVYPSSTSYRSLVLCPKESRSAVSDLTGYRKSPFKWIYSR